MSSLAIPSPNAVADVHSLCGHIEAALPTITDVDMLHDAKAKLTAIDAYIAMTSTEGRAQVQATVRRITQRVGEVLGDKRQGERTDLSGAHEKSPLSTDERYVARKFAEHPDVVEDVIAASDDFNPPSERKVLNAIRAKEQSQQMARDEAELDEAVEQIGLRRLTDPIEIAQQRRRIEVRAHVAGVIRDVLTMRDRYSDAQLAALTAERLWPTTRAQAIEAAQFLTHLSRMEAIA